MTAPAPAVRVETRRSVPAPPLRPDGARYRYELIDGAGRFRVYADEVDALVAEIIPGYAELPDEAARLEARSRTLIRPQILAQASLNLESDLDSCDDEQRAVLEGSRDRQPALTEWSAPVPLVLIAGYYEPQGALPRPEAVPPGEILWLDPGTEDSFLRALRVTGAIKLAQSIATI